MVIDYIKSPPNCVLVTAISDCTAYTVNFAGQPSQITLHRDSDRTNYKAGNLLLLNGTKAKDDDRAYFILCVAAYNMDKYLEQNEE